MKQHLIEPLERRVLLSGGGIYNEGVLTIVGTTLSNEIHISYTHEGVHVRVDRQEELFQDPVHTIAVDAGDGDNVVNYRQLVAADVALGIVTGDGEDDIDIAFDLIESTRTAIDGRILTFAVDVDAGGGADRVKVQFSWLSGDDEAAFHFDFAADIRPGGAGFTPEIGDEVIVGLEYGHPDQPIIIGAVYNSGGAAAGTGQPRLGLRNLARDLSATTELHFTGSGGNDELDLSADYSGVRLQQGAILLDADFNEGDNRFGGYIVTSARHTHVASNIAAGDGNNEISLIGHELTHTVQQRSGISDGTSNTVFLSETRLGHGNNVIQVNTTDYDFIHHLVELGDGDNSLASRVAKIDSFTWKQTVVKQEIVLGDGNNETHLSFGDGQHGRRPPTGQSTINTTYRSGAGSDTIVIDGEANSPVAAEFVLEPGGENNTLNGRYVFGDWSTRVLPGGARPHPQHVKIHLGNPMDELSFTVEELPPADAPGRPAEFVIVVVGQKTRGTLDYLKTVGDPALPAGSDNEFKYVPVRRAFAFHDLSADTLSFEMVNGDNRVHLGMGDITLKRGVIRLAQLQEVSGLTIERQTIELELDGFEVSGSAAVGMHIDGPGSSRTVFRDVTVNETATLSFDGVTLKQFQELSGLNVLELHDLQIDGVFTADLQTGQSSASLNAENIVLKRGITHSNAVALESMKLANEGFEMDYEGLDVFGSFSLVQELHGRASSSTVLRDVHVHEGATAYWETGVIILDISERAPSSGGWFRNPPTVSLSLHDLQVDGEFAATVQGGDAVIHLAMANASVGHAGIDILNIADPANRRSGETSDYLVIILEAVHASGWYSMSVNTGSRGGLVSYIQDRVIVEDGATMDVRLNGGDGNDTILALLRDISIVGDGSYSFTTDGGAGDDFIAVLARDLDPGAEGSMSFEVLGGEGNDVLALAVVAPTVRGDAIFARIDGGRGFNACFATSNVLVANCSRHLSGDDILRLLRRHLAGMDVVNSKEYTDEWSTAV